MVCLHEWSKVSPFLFNFADFILTTSTQVHHLSWKIISHFLHNLVLKTELERKFKNKKHRRQNFQKLLAMYNTQLEGNNVCGWQTAKNASCHLKKIWSLARNYSWILLQRHWFMWHLMCTLKYSVVPISYTYMHQFFLPKF